MMRVFGTAAHSHPPAPTSHVIPPTSHPHQPRASCGETPSAIAMRAGPDSAGSARQRRGEQQRACLRARPLRHRAGQPATKAASNPTSGERPRDANAAGEVSSTSARGPGVSSRRRASTPCRADDASTPSGARRTANPGSYRRTSSHPRPRSIEQGEGQTRAGRSTERPAHKLRASSLSRVRIAGARQLDARVGLLSAATEAAPVRSRQLRRVPLPQRASDENAGVPIRPRTRVDTARVAVPSRARA